MPPSRCPIYCPPLPCPLQVRWLETPHLILHPSLCPRWWVASRIGTLPGCQGAWHSTRAGTGRATGVWQPHRCCSGGAAALGRTVAPVACTLPSHSCSPTRGCVSSKPPPCWIDRGPGRLRRRRRSGGGRAVAVVSVFPGRLLSRRSAGPGVTRCEAAPAQTRCHQRLAAAAPSAAPSLHPPPSARRLRPPGTSPLGMEGFSFPNTNRTIICESRC